MKETNKIMVVELDAVSPDTGEVFQIKGKSLISNKYYSILKLTTRMNHMDFVTVIEKTCKSPKDIYTFKQLNEEADKENIIRFENITKFAKRINVDRKRMTMMLKKLREVNYLLKMDVGVYFINPFIFIGRKTRSNAEREHIQELWTECRNDEYYDDIQ